MVYQQIEYQVRASLGRNEWVILIYYPDNAGGKSTNSKFTGTKEEAAGAARRKIDNWLKEQKRKALLPPRPSKGGTTTRFEEPDMTDPISRRTTDLTPATRDPSLGHATPPPPPSTPRPSSPSE